MSYTKKLNTILPNVDGRTCFAIGEITDVKYENDYGEAHYATITEINGEKTNFKAIIELSGESDLDRGDIFVISGVGEALGDYDKYLRSLGYIGKIVCDDAQRVSIIGKADKTLLSYFKHLNKELEVQIYRYTDSETGPLVSALILGNRGDISDKINKDFRRAGITHALSLSGLHMTIIMGFFEYVLMSLRMDKKYRCILLVFIAFLYLALTGFTAPAFRSVLMASCLYMSYLFRTASDGITSLVLSAAIILAVSPTSIFDISFWLSELSTLGLLIAAEIVSPLGYLIKKKRIGVQIAYKLLLSVSLTVAAIFFVMIFTWLWFGETSLMAPLSNMIINPIFDAIIALGLILLLVSPIPFIGNIVGIALNIMCKLVLGMLSFVSNLSGVQISLNYPFVGYIVVPLSIGIVLFLVLKFNYKWLISLLPAAAMVAFAVCLSIHTYQNRGLTKVEYLRNGTSEMLVLTNNDKTTILDISTGGYSHMSSAYQAAFDNCATEIDSIILTHYHNYHTNSLYKVTQKYTVKKVFLPIPENADDDEFYFDIVRALSKSDTEIVLYERGYKLDAGGGCDVIVSDEFYIDRSKHPMLMISVKAKEELLYYSSPVFEHKDADYPSLPDHIIIGAHGPNIHDVPDLTLAESSVPRTLLLANGEKMVFSKENLEILRKLSSLANTDIVIDKEEYEFLISSN